MLHLPIVRATDFCTRHPWFVIGVSLLLMVASGVYAAQNFAINTDISKLISTEPDWRQREIDYQKAFPRLGNILVVVDAPTAEQAEQARDLLAQRMEQNAELFPTVRRPGSGDFFEQNGLLFLPLQEVTTITDRITQAEPIMSALAADPSLRGVVNSLAFATQGVKAKEIELDQIPVVLNPLNKTLEEVLAGRTTAFSWSDLMRGGQTTVTEKRRFIETFPKLDFSALEPGRQATDAIRQAARDLNLAERYQANVRLTGFVPLGDEEFGTVKEGAFLNSLLTILAVLFILYLALKSARIIFAVIVSLTVGLAITAALGLMMVGAFNLISVAFFVLFVGLGVDFGIQYSVRYRAERHKNPDLRGAIHNASNRAGAQLTLAAAAVACGFFSFLPTQYKGLSELGLIAGVGMLIAFITSVTTLPALLQVLNPPGEPEGLGFRSLAPVDAFMERHRIGIVIGTIVIVVAGLPLLYWVRFDFNPFNLRSPKVESVATYLELRKDPVTSGNTIEILMPSLAEADRRAEELGKMPTVASTRTLSFFIPKDQEQKLELIRNMGQELEAVVTPQNAKEPPTDAENVQALRTAAANLTEIAGTGNSPGAEAARRSATLLTQLADAPAERRERATEAFVPSLKMGLASIVKLTMAQPITMETLPEEVVREWRAPDGRMRISVTPKGDPNNNDEMRAFAQEMLKVEPRATGGPVSIQESGRTIVNAFLQAGAWSLLSITILLWITLRRFTDVMLTLIPLIVAGIVTLEICVLIGMPLNFANIIALPLLLGVGVAFKIYYIMAWRAGGTNLLQSSLTRAVFFSACTTATAFGSLWFSSHPGTSSMGKLLALSLLTTMLAAVLFQPLLMGPPREKVGDPDVH